jgi:hypothetical protein
MNTDKTPYLNKNTARYVTKISPKNMKFSYNCKFYWLTRWSILTCTYCAVYKPHVKNKYGKMRSCCIEGSNQGIYMERMSTVYFAVYWTSHWAADSERRRLWDSDWYAVKHLEVVVASRATIAVLTRRLKKKTWKPEDIQYPCQYSNRVPPNIYSVTSAPNCVVRAKELMRSHDK